MVHSSSFELLKGSIVQIDGDLMFDPATLEFQTLIAGAFQIRALTAWRHRSDE